MKEKLTWRNVKILCEVVGAAAGAAAVVLLKLEAK